MRSFLEIESMDARHKMVTRSDYQKKNNEYSETNPDALAPKYSDGDSKVHTMADGRTYTLGKGTGHAGHSSWLPHASSTIGTFNYSNFDTAIASEAGNELDISARNEALTRSLYTPDKPYGMGDFAIDTALNVAEGQYTLKM